LLDRGSLSTAARRAATVWLVRRNREDVVTDDSNARCSTHRHCSGTPADARYDLIVCGSGSSGSVVARRLVEHPEMHVLLLEAGGIRDSISCEFDLMAGTTTIRAELGVSRTTESASERPLHFHDDEHDAWRQIEHQYDA
jgi:hypothetical protein